MTAPAQDSCAIADFLCTADPLEWPGVFSPDVRATEKAILAHFPGATFDDFAAGLLIAKARIEVQLRGGGQA